MIEFRSEKHLRDIAAMLAESGAEVDHDLLNRQLPERGLDAAWQRAKEIDFEC